MSEKQPLVYPPPQPRPPAYNGPPASYNPGPTGPTAPPPAYGYQPVPVPPPQAPPPPPPAYGYQPVPPPHNPPYVTTAQPSPVVYNDRRVSGDHFMTLSIVLTILCCVCGTWWALLCTIPAIIIAGNAQEADRRGDTEQAMRNHRTALYLNIAAIATYVVSWILIVIMIIVRVTVIASAESHYYYYYNY